MKDKSKFVLQILDEMLQALEAGVDRAPQVKMQGDIKPGSTVLIEKHTGVMSESW